MKFNLFPGNTANTVTRGLDYIREHFPPLVEEYNNHKTAADRSGGLADLDKITGRFLSLALTLKEAVQAGETDLIKKTGTPKKERFFDVAKEIKQTLRETSLFLGTLIKEFNTAGKEGNNRQKSICFEDLEKAVSDLFYERVELKVRVYTERRGWLNAICSYHDGNRDNLIWKTPAQDTDGKADDI